MITIDRESVLVPIGKDGERVLNATVKELTVAGEKVLWQIIEENKELSFTEAYYQGTFNALIYDCVDLPEGVSMEDLPLSIKDIIFQTWKDIGGNSDFFQTVEARMSANAFDSIDMSGISALLKSGALPSLNEDTETQINTEENDL